MTFTYFRLQVLETFCRNLSGYFPLVNNSACSLKTYYNETKFNVHGFVNRKNILIYIQQDATLHSLFYLKTAPLHVSGGTSTHHQRRIQLIYSIWYLSRRYCYLPLSWKSWNWFECAVGGVRHPQHTETSSSSSTIVADSSNGVTNTRCCRYSSLRSC
jgi:hypothetical protein